MHRIEWCMQSHRKKSTVYKVYFIEDILKEDVEKSFWRHWFEFKNISIYLQKYAFSNVSYSHWQKKKSMHIEAEVQKYEFFYEFIVMTLLIYYNPLSILFIKICL